MDIPLSLLIKSIFIENADIITYSVHAGISRAKEEKKQCCGQGRRQGRGRIQCGSTNNGGAIKDKNIENILEDTAHQLDHASTLKDQVKDQAGKTF